MAEHFDPECLRLAKHFLAGERPGTPAALCETEENELAQEIQRAVESWFEYRDGTDNEGADRGAPRAPYNIETGRTK